MELLGFVMYIRCEIQPQETGQQKIKLLIGGVSVVLCSSQARYLARTIFNTVKELNKSNNAGEKHEPESNSKNDRTS
jgi:hypothetical protein